MEIEIFPYIISGVHNNKLSKHTLDICRQAISTMKIESKKDRLSDNYDKWLKLERMAIYCITYDKVNNLPILATGAQHMSKNTCRLFSRYYLFRNYRTKHNEGLYNKVDNFQTEFYMLKNLQSIYKLFFWSRDKGNNFFKRIKKNRADLFADWKVYPDLLEILWEGNLQGVMYYGDEKYLKELSVRK